MLYGNSDIKMYLRVEGWEGVYWIYLARDKGSNTDGLGTSCRENQNIHFMFNNFFSEDHTVYEIMSKNLVEPEGPQKTSQYGAYALRAGLARLHARTRMRTPTLPRTHTHARTHARTCIHLQANNNTYCFSTAPQCYVTPVFLYTWL
jgi:hypothetical protein